VMDAGGGFDSGAFISRPAPFEQERSVLANSAYSYTQAKRLFEGHKKLRREFENYSRKINNLLASGEAQNSRAAELKQRLDDIYKDHFSGTDAVERVFDKMAERLDHYGLREDDLLEAAGSMPDGLDPMFVGRVRGIR